MSTDSAPTTGTAPNGTVVLAYSGGLDTSALIPWLREKYGYDVVACLVDLGRVKDIPMMMQRALASGAIAAEAIDAKEEFAEHHCLPAQKKMRDRPSLSGSITHSTILALVQQFVTSDLVYR